MFNSRNSGINALNAFPNYPILSFLVEYNLILLDQEAAAAAIQAEKEEREKRKREKPNKREVISAEESQSAQSTQSNHSNFQIIDYPDSENDRSVSKSHVLTL